MNQTGLADTTDKEWSKIKILKNHNQHLKMEIKCKSDAKKEI